MDGAPRDPRVGPVEDNFLDFVAALASGPGVRREGRPDVTTYSRDVWHPLFNGIAGARFPPERAEVRAGEVLGAYLVRGRPFLWWTTPSTTSPELERALERVGMLRVDSPGMHLDLRARAAEPSADRTPRTPAAGVELRPAGPHDRPTVARLVLAAFGMSPTLAADFTRLLDGPDPGRFRHVLALVEGEPVGCGSVWVAGRTAGLYDIATLPAVRGRGVGAALTAGLVGTARDLGCSEVVLHATDPGRGIYERLGFTEVCTVGQHLWVPPR